MNLTPRPRDLRIQEVVDAALETYLGFGGER